MQRLFRLALAGLLAAPAVVPASAATLKMRFVYDGDPPQSTMIDPNRDTQFCGQHNLVDETLVVDDQSKGIANVVVFVDTRGTKDLPEDQSEPQTVVLANKNCRFEPHVVITKVGDTLKITNPDPVGHNCAINFFRNDPVNPMIPAGQETLVELKQAEPAPIPASCSIHPWMQARVVVLDNRLAASSEADGTLTIEGLPEGDVSFKINHEGGRIHEVMIDGKKEKWRSGKFELTLKEGINDLGDVMVPPASFE